jgi:hypothetical protein
VIEKRVLRRIFAFNREEVKGAAPPTQFMAQIYHTFLQKEKRAIVKPQCT